MQSYLMNVLRDKQLTEQLLGKLESDQGLERLDRDALSPDRTRSIVESLSHGNEMEVDPAYEAIILKYGRPVLYIQDDRIAEPELELWRTRMAPSRALLETEVPRVGRIELRGHPRFTWVGTGWLVAPRVVVTNRHVAEIFARESGGRFDYRLDPVGRPMRARIDLYEEHERPRESEFAIREIIHIEDEDGPDMAFLRVAPVDQDDRPLPDPIALADREPVRAQVIGAIGYAAWDGDRNDRAVMDRIFEAVYEVKRFHPGEVMDVRTSVITHDCSTLGGNSGSVLLDFETGKAVALHFAGRYEGSNHAVKASVVRAKLSDLGIDVGRGV